MMNKWKFNGGLSPAVRRHARMPAGTLGVFALIFWGVLKMNAAENLDGVSGKVFRVDGKNRSFEFLKETVIDPKTNEGKSRHTLRWTDRTDFTKVVRQNNFAGIPGPVVARFHNLDENNARAAAAGEPFKCKAVTIFPADAIKPAGMADDGRSVTARFTPDPDSPKLRDGAIELDGKTVPVTLPGPGAQVEIRMPAGPDDILKGFWEAKIHGRRGDDGFVVESMDIYPLLDPRTVDDPGLPRVLVVGDSISMNYHEAAKAELAGIANYYRIEGNGGPSDRGVACMELWLGDYTQPGLGWDLIQFNHGLHDLKQYYDEATKTYGAYQVDVESYKANLEKEIAIMRKTGATLMWCTTTPVPASSVGHWKEGAMGRRNGADLVFNQAALEVMSKHPDILINDLNKAVREAAFHEEWRKGTDVHFWHRNQQEVVGKAVADAIKKALAARD